MYATNPQLERAPEGALGSGLRIQAPGRGAVAERASRRALPNRYRIKKNAKGKLLTCAEAPTVSVRVRRGVTVTEAEARSFSPGSIFLDGAAQGEPFLDPGRAVYNLDHHEGCVRAFTLSCCEQAMVLIRKGLDLRRRDWTVYANDADLDTILAIWVLFNHLRLNDESSRTRSEIMPLLRLEGAIDAHGLELQDLCALPPKLYLATRARMDRIRERELALKGKGLWDQIDLAHYIADRLRMIDSFVYLPHQFDDVEEIEELAKAQLCDGSVAIACRSQAGIYEVERQLRRFHGGRLGLIVLQKDPNTYTVRQVDPSLPATLKRVYDHLNFVDPAAGTSRSSNRWGGSAEIGGSPRRSGTRLSLRRIVEVCQQAYRKPTRLERALCIARTAATSCIVLLVATSPVAFAKAVRVASSDILKFGIDPRISFATIIAILGAGLFLVAAWRRPGLYGLRSPASRDWWRLLPLALVAALAGGAWAPRPTGGGEGLLGAVAIVALPGLAVAVGAELLFRGWVHGSLVWGSRIQSAGGPWFVSSPVLVSAALYAGCGVAVGSLGLSLPHGVIANEQAIIPPLGALLFGIAAGMARERSESILPPILLHALGGAALWLAVAQGV